MSDETTKHEDGAAIEGVERRPATPAHDQPTESATGEPDGDESEETFTVHDRRFWVQEDVADDKSKDGADAEEPAAPRKPSYVQQLETELAERDERLKAYIEAHKRAEREFQETRDRLTRQNEEELDREKARLVTDFFEVLDNLDRSVDAATPAGGFEALHDGVKIVRKQFMGVLEGLGLTHIDPLGETFDPTYHEAVTTIPVGAKDHDQTVQDVLRRGYRRGDQVLRPAMVVVGRYRAV